VLGLRPLQRLPGPGELVAGRGEVSHCLGHVAPLEVDVAAVQEHQAGLRVVLGQQLQGLVKCGDRSLGVAAAHQEQSQLGPDQASRLGGEISVKESGAPGDPRRSVTGLRLGVRQGEVDAGGQVGIVGGSTGSVEQSDRPSEGAAVDCALGPGVQFICRRHASSWR
jgi:hypothetical protein